jgi:hypothetical protein
MGVSVIPIKVPALQAGQEYTQDKRDRFNVSLPVDKVRGLTWGDKAATLYVEESDNGSTWVATKTTAIVAKTTADTGWVTLSKRYYRFRIKNGTATQGSITLYQQIVGMGSYLDMEEQAGIVVLDHGIPAANPVPTQLTGSKVKNAFEIIPDDATDLSHETIAVYIGFDGDLKVDLISGETITMYNLAAGAWHPIQAKRVYATGTAATYILGAY